MKHHVIIALGTNVNEWKINEAQKIIKSISDDFSFSQTIQTEPIGKCFQNTMFYNALAVGTVGEIQPSELVCILKKMEHACGDNVQLRKKGTVVIDLDLLKYDSLIFHEADWNRPYIKKLVKDFLHSF